MQSHCNVSNFVQNQHCRSCGHQRTAGCQKIPAGSPPHRAQPSAAQGADGQAPTKKLEAALAAAKQADASPDVISALEKQISEAKAAEKAKLPAAQRLSTAIAAVRRTEAARTRASEAVDKAAAALEAAKTKLEQAKEAEYLADQELQAIRKEVGSGTQAPAKAAGSPSAEAVLTKLTAILKEMSNLPPAAASVLQEAEAAVAEADTQPSDVDMTGTQQGIHMPTDQELEGFVKEMEAGATPEAKKRRLKELLTPQKPPGTQQAPLSCRQHRVSL